MTHTPTPQELHEFKDVMQKILSELNWKGSEQITEPQFDTAMVEWYTMYEAYHQHKLMEQEDVEDINLEGIPFYLYQYITKLKEQARKVAALQEYCMMMKEQFESYHKQLTEANAEKESLMAELKKVSFENSKSLDTLQTIINEKNAEIERLKTIWTSVCECQDSPGQTWCCNHCGKPYRTNP